VSDAESRVQGAQDAGDLPADGYIKYQAEWVRQPCEIPAVLLAELERWRSRMRELGLVGVLPDGVGFGNLSARSSASGPFWITGSATGGLHSLTAQHYARVDALEIARNWLRATGLTEASSESLTHGAIYGALPECRAVIHVHSRLLWSAMLDRRTGDAETGGRSGFPATDPAAAYGTPAMARELARLAPLAWGSTDAGVVAAAEDGESSVPRAGWVAMAGHPDGVMAFGSDLTAAGDLLCAQLRLISG